MYTICTIATHAGSVGASGSKNPVPIIAGVLAGLAVIIIVAIGIILYRRRKNATPQRLPPAKRNSGNTTTEDHKKPRHSMSKDSHQSYSLDQVGYKYDPVVGPGPHEPDPMPDWKRRSSYSQSRSSLYDPPADYVSRNSHSYGHEDRPLVHHSSTYGPPATSPRSSMSHARLYDPFNPPDSPPQRSSNFHQTLSSQSHQSFQSMGMPPPQPSGSGSRRNSLAQYPLPTISQQPRRDSLPESWTRTGQSRSASATYGGYPELS